MSIKYNSLEYEMPWRPNYEYRAGLGWIAAALVTSGVNLFSAMPPEPFYYMSGICVTMAALRFPKAFSLYRLQKNLKGRSLSFIELEDLKKKIKNNPDDIWLGHGFEWETRHAQRAYEVLKRDTSSLIPQSNNKESLAMGQTWIHGVEPKEKDIYQPIKHAEGHTLIVGTTGSGKTRAFDTLISQAILRNETVIIIDPKGDKELVENAKRACEALGEPERFLMFNPAFPEDSIRIDVLANFTRGTELASRIAALIPSETGNDPFTSFGWLALNNIINGLLIIDSQPNLTVLRRYLENGAANLVIQAIDAYGSKNLSGYEEKRSARVAKVQAKGREAVAQSLSRLYYTEIQPHSPSSDLEGLLSMFEHDSAHFGKMIATLLPVMSMLTSGPLGKLLSPDIDDPTDKRKIFNSTSIIQQKKVLCLGLDSLTDSMVGSAIGSLLLSDLAAVAGDRYNYGIENLPVNVFVDEAAEVLNDPMIQLLNKGRGALLRLNVATQTFADFSARLGSENKARQVLGNINNILALRVVDAETQEYIVKGLPKTRVKYVMRTQGQNTDSSEPILHGGNQGERLMDEEFDLFPAPLLGQLPNLEYVAKISGGRFIKGRLPILVEKKK